MGRICGCVLQHRRYHKFCPSSGHWLSERCITSFAKSSSLLEKCLLCQISKGLCVGSWMDCRSYWPNIYSEVALHHMCCISTWFGSKCPFTSKVLTKSQCGCESLPVHPLLPCPDQHSKVHKNRKPGNIKNKATGTTLYSQHAGA